MGIKIKIIYINNYYHLIFMANKEKTFPAVENYSNFKGKPRDFIIG